MKESLSVRFLYKTAAGRVVLKLLVNPGVSKAGGKLLSARISRCAIPFFIKKHKIDMSDIIVPEKGFSSFNDFFTRKRKSISRDVTPGHLISPCDGFLKVVEINKDTCFTIKHSVYSVKDLIDDDELSKDFECGTALIFRLTPANYHRYSYPANGEIVSSKIIPGVLHCVRPAALEAFPVFIQNSREYQVINSDDFGKVIQMEIGALMVGKITNYKRPQGASRVSAGEEKGYFEFGGSTIVLLFQKDAVCVDEKLYKEVNDDEEIKVRLGQVIALKK